MRKAKNVEGREGSRLIPLLVLRSVTHHLTSERKKRLLQDNSKSRNLRVVTRTDARQRKSPIYNLQLTIQRSASTSIYSRFSSGLTSLAPVLVLLYFGQLRASGTLEGRPVSFLRRSGFASCSWQ